MSSGMSRRQKNRSMFDQTKSRILWTIEFVFGDERFLRHRIDENMTLGEVFDKAVGTNLALRHRLTRQSFAFLQAPASRSAPFRRIPLHTTLKYALASSTIIEFPVLHIVPDNDLPLYQYVDVDDMLENHSQVDLSFQTSFSSITAF